MGLDHWLKAKRHIFLLGNEEKMLGDRISDLFKGTPAEGLEVDDVTFELIRWRKMNALHGWFVRNVQEGTDDCGDYNVEIEDIKKLLISINIILAHKGDKKKAMELLPPESGFFFGDAEVNDYYYEELARTRDTLSGIADNPERWEDFSFQYGSSW